MDDRPMTAVTGDAVPLITWMWGIDGGKFFTLRVRLQERGVGSWSVGIADIPVALKWRTQFAKWRLMRRRTKFLKKVNRANNKEALLGELVGGQYSP